MFMEGETIMLKTLLYVYEKRLSMNMLDMITSILLSCILYLSGLRTGFSYWVIVLVSSIFLMKAIYAFYRILKIQLNKSK